MEKECSFRPLNIGLCMLRITTDAVLEYGAQPATGYGSLIAKELFTFLL